MDKLHTVAFFLVLLLLSSPYFSIIVPRALADSTNWWNTAFQYRLKITFNNSAVSENLTNFPMPIVLASSQTNFWSHVNRTTGSDVRLVDADNSTELYFEVEQFDTTNNATVMWVKVPQVDASSTTDYIWLYYGNSTSAFDSYCNKTQAWNSNYGGVWHLDDLLDDDSTGKNSNATITGSPTVATGMFYSSIDYGTTAQAYATNLGTGSSISMAGASNFTVEAWVYYDVNSTNQVYFHQSQGSSSWNVVFGTYALDIANSSMKFIHRDTSSATRDSLCIDTPTTVWTYYVGTYNAPNYKALYLNGALAANTTAGQYSPLAAIRAGPTTATQIGYGGDYGPMDGRVDEVRISLVTYSSAWIQACYQYEVDQSKFTFASEDAYSTGPNLSFVSSEVANTVSSGVSSVELGFTSGNGLNLLGNGLVGRGLGFPKSEALQLVPNSLMNKAVGLFASFSLSLFDSVSLGRENRFLTGNSVNVLDTSLFSGLSNLPSALFELWSSGKVLMSKELGFAPNNILSLSPTSRVGTETGFSMFASILLNHLTIMLLGNQNYSFNVNDILFLNGANSLGQGLGFPNSVSSIVNGLPVLSKALGFSGNNAVSFSSMLLNPKELAFQTFTALNLQTASSYGKSLTYANSAIATVNELSSFLKGLGFISNNAVSFSSTLLNPKELAFGLPGSITVSTSLVSGREFGFMASLSVVVNGANAFLKGLGFAPNNAVTLTSVSSLNKELTFTPTSTLSLSPLSNMGKGLGLSVAVSIIVNDFARIGIPNFSFDVNGMLFLTATNGLNRGLGFSNADSLSLSTSIFLGKERLFSSSSVLLPSSIIVSGLERGFSLGANLFASSYSLFGHENIFSPSDVSVVSDFSGFGHENLFGLSSTTSVLSIVSSGIEKNFIQSNSILAQDTFSFSLITPGVNYVFNVFSTSSVSDSLGAFGQLSIYPASSGPPITVNLYPAMQPSFFSLKPILTVEAYMPTFMSNVRALYIFLFTMAYPAHIQAVCVPPQTATVNVQTITVITVPDLNYSAVLTHTLDGNESITEDVTVSLPFLGPQSYSYHVSTTYLYGNTLISQSSMDGTLTVQSWWLWLWAGIVVVLVLGSVGGIVGSYKLSERRKRNKLKEAKLKAVIRTQNAVLNRK